MLSVDLGSEALLRRRPVEEAAMEPFLPRPTVTEGSESAQLCRQKAEEGVAEALVLEQSQNWNRMLPPADLPAWMERPGLVSQKQP